MEHKPPERIEPKVDNPLNMTFDTGWNACHDQFTAYIKELQSEHCKDCCCARAWEALGVKEYTGKSISEHITELKLNVDKLQGRDRKVIRELCGLAIGKASLCWNPKPKGVFDSSAASETVEELTDAICAKFTKSDVKAPSGDSLTTDSGDEREALNELFLSKASILRDDIYGDKFTISKKDWNQICSTFRADGRLERLEEKDTATLVYMAQECWDKEDNGWNSVKFIQLFNKRFGVTKEK